MRLAFDHMAIAVADRAASDAFYCDVLGAELVDVGFGTCAYRFGEQLVVALPPGGPAPASLRHPLRPGAAHFCLVWPGPIAVAIEHLAHHRIALAEPPRPHTGAQGQGTSIYVHDPDGMLLELISYAG